MSVSNSLLNEFINSVMTQKNEKRSNISYGVLAELDGKKFVKLDGSNQLTPITEALGAENGDRVSVEIINHRAIVTGNFTEPPSSRYATSYLKTVNGGMLVGEIKDGSPIGNYLIIKNDGVLVSDQNGKILATFKGSELELGNAGTGVIRFCNDKVRLRSTSFGSSLEATGGTNGIRFIIANDIEHNDDGSEGVTGPRADIYMERDYSGVSITLSVAPTLFSNDRTVLKLSQNGINMYVPNGKNVTINNKKILTET